MTWLGIAIVIASMFLYEGLTNVAKAIGYLADAIKKNENKHYD